MSGILRLTLLAPNLWFTGYDALLPEVMAAIHNGDLKATWQYLPFGVEAVEVAVRILEGRVPKEIVFSSPLITKENVGELWDPESGVMRPAPSRLDMIDLWDGDGWRARCSSAHPPPPHAIALTAGTPFDTWGTGSVGFSLQEAPVVEDLPRHGRWRRAVPARSEERCDPREAKKWEQPMNRIARLSPLAAALAMAMAGATATHAAEVTLDFATALPDGGSEARAMNHFKEVLEAKTDGAIEVNLFLGGVLGKEKSVFEQLNVGEVHMNLGGEIVITTYAPEYYIFGVPFLFPDRETVGELVGGELGERMAEAVLERSNIMVAGYSLRMGRQLITEGQRVLKPEDVEGLKIRLPNIDSWQVAWKQLGAIPTPIPAVEIFQALQSGIVEAAENPISPMFAMRQHEVTDYLILTDHLYSFRAWSVSKPFFDSLSEAHQQALLESVDEATTYLNAIESEVDAELLVRAQEEGEWQVLIPDRAAFKAAVLPALEEIRQDWAPGLYEQYVEPYVDGTAG